MPEDDAKRLAESRLGRVLRGKYRLDRVIGIGGMAVVYAATHRNKKRVAIKMLHPELSIRENIRTRFLREGYVANSVDHPGAVAVLDDDIAEDGSAFVVMELLDGSPLDEVAARHSRRVPFALVVSIADALLDVLIAAHAKGVIHRDIKPANVFLTNDGRLEVLDFGIARLHDETAGDATQTGAMLGTPAFMPAEQALGQSSKVDGRTDLWAVGATIFVLLTGQLVHEGENASQLLIAAGTRRARSIRSVAPDIPLAIAEVVDKALAFEKEARWAGAKEMREALASAYVTATGAPVAPLPKTEKVSGLEATLASDEAVAPGSSGAGFEPTVDAGAQKSATNGVATTGAGVEKKPTPSPSEQTTRARRYVVIAALGIALLGAIGWRATRSRPNQSHAAQDTAVSSPRGATAASPPDPVAQRHAAANYTNIANAEVEAAQKAEGDDVIAELLSRAVEQYRLAATAWAALHADRDSDESYENAYWLAQARHEAVRIEVLLHKLKKEPWPTPQEIADARQAAVAVRDAKDGTYLMNAALFVVDLSDYDRDIAFQQFVDSDAAAGLEDRQQPHYLGKDGTGRPELDPIPPQIQTSMQARYFFIERVPPTMDVTHNAVEFQIYNAGQFFLYGYFDEARQRYEPIYDKHCGKDDYGYDAWDHLITMSNHVGDAARSRELALKEKKHPCAMTPEQKAKAATVLAAVLSPPTHAQH
jgi:serine/threonine-protein kinase